MENNQQVTLIVDANTTNLYPANPLHWEENPDPGFYKGTATWINGTASNRVSFSSTFHGTSISFWGKQPVINTTSFIMTVDRFLGVNDTQKTIDPPRSNLYTEWYRSQPLADEEHTIYGFDLTLIWVDFYLITAGDTTPLSGHTVVVDDAALDEILYRGQWNMRINETVATGVGEAFAMGNTTHVTNTMGDSFEFNFAGTSISVYGIFDWSVGGHFTLEFNLDGDIVQNTYSPETRTVAQNDYQKMTNYLFFNSTALTPGNHSLLVSLTDIGGIQSFQLDYLTYNPSYSFISEKPSFNSRGDSPGTKTVGNTGPSPSNTTGANQDQGSQKSLSGVQIGGIVGGIDLLYYNLPCSWSFCS
ncbi:hypothetical protein VNI00_014580 [Paramarasmius palmivorus]|uniref:Uncharacterized protein n=1 Tax=Paramarasmius palmivorus TaxID=297713 RepID=A0AAW0BTH3_9AGAR